jgi:hypothetical protein
MLHTDLFLNYLYEKPKYWESLRIMVNLVIDAYKTLNPDALIKPILGKIKVRTQYKYILSKDLKVTREQDLKITENDGTITYVELQNRADMVPPIELRSVGYFGLGIGHGNGKIVDQIWLLGENADTVLHGEAIARYILKDELANTPHPYTAGILYASLPRLKNDNNPLGELAMYLLGEATNPTNEQVKQITVAFGEGFEDFKNEKEVPEMMTIAERWTANVRAEALAEGRAEGEARGKSEGILEQSLFIARNMKKTDMDYQLISTLTGLTLEEVENA